MPLKYNVCGFYGRGLAYLAVITVALGTWCWVWGRYALVAAIVAFCALWLGAGLECMRRDIRR